MFPQIPISSINELNPLWCQGTDSQVVPNGLTISFNSFFTDIEIIGMNNIGLLVPEGSNVPEGLFTCAIDGVASTIAELGSS